MSQGEFSKSVRTIVAERAAYICSNPACRCLTLHLLDVDQVRAAFRGKAVHICAPAENGARYDAQLNSNQRKAIDNAIFLCMKCAERINRNKGIDHPAALLRFWKEQHKRWVREHLNLRLEAPVASKPARKTALAKPAAAARTGGKLTRPRASPFS